MDDDLDQEFRRLFGEESIIACGLSLKRRFEEEGWPFDARIYVFAFLQGFLADLSPSERQSFFRDELPSDAIVRVAVELSRR